MFFCAAPLSCVFVSQFCASATFHFLTVAPCFVSGVKTTPHTRGASSFFTKKQLVRCVLAASSDTAALCCLADPALHVVLFGVLPALHYIFQLPTQAPSGLLPLKCGPALLSWNFSLSRANKVIHLLLFTFHRYLVFFCMDPLLLFVLVTTVLVSPWFVSASRNHLMLVCARLPQETMVLEQHQDLWYFF